ncbi:TPA: hypothetical protein ACW0QD_000741 [Citrobacter freundii]|uniref:hypothetical protein n=1 Tax=Citrobacter freundii TaxID=546 RepID=UPI001908FC65|nr:hypothetical protein [Citrobacter freundii]MBJ8946409.1 hypothetical protein [Citrobacter freundii]
MSYIMPEKGQMNEYGIEAFGIPLTSRHGVAMELSQMLRFSYYVASVGLVKCIESVFYDSGSCCCNFEFIPGFNEYSEEAEKIKQCALRSIGQFEWFGMIEHGDING